MGLKSHEIPAAHEVVKGDPRIDGPYLDDHNAAYEDARRNARLVAQENQNVTEGDAVTEGTELGVGGREERVLSETPTTVTTVVTESKLDAPEETPEDKNNDSSGADENDE